MAPLLAAVTVSVNDPGTDRVWRLQRVPSDPPGVSTANAERWRARLTRTRNPARIRFTREGAHLANNVLVPWTDAAARLPKLPEVLACIRDCDLAWWLHGCHSADVATLYEALDARGLVPTASVARTWWKSCPASGTPACDLLNGTRNPLDSNPRASCRWCHGDGFVTYDAPSSVWELASLCVHGDRVTRAEGFAQGVAEAAGVPFARVAWHIPSAQDLAWYHRDRYARIGQRSYDAVTAFAREQHFATQRVLDPTAEHPWDRPWNEASPFENWPDSEAHRAWPALRGIGLLGLHLLDQPKPAGVVLAAPYL